MNNLKDILIFLNKIEKLKTVQRALCVSDNSRKESPAEHTWRVAMMAIILHQELNLKIDLLKALKIILVHDIVEVCADDVWILDKKDIEAKNHKQEKEEKAAEEIYALLPGYLENDLKSLWKEYSEKSSPEAKFACALDKIECIIQRNDLGVKNWERDDIFDVVFHWADDAVEEFPELKELWKMVQEDLIRSKEII